MKKTTQLLTLALAAGCGSALSGQILINEFRSNPPGTDPGTETMELIATGGETSFTGFWQSIEGDSGFDLQNSGTINVTFDANGLATFDTGDIENPSFTFFISSVDYSGATAIGDIDSSNVLDAIGVLDSGSDSGYGATLGGIDLGYIGEPEIVFRESNNNDWYLVDQIGNDTTIFDAAGTNVSAGLFDTDPSVGTTFGAVNPAVPEPSVYAAALGLLALGLVAWRRRR
jgi:MYXO-CTERM domain-containing protein